MTALRCRDHQGLGSPVVTIREARSRSAPPRPSAGVGFAARAIRRPPPYSGPSALPGIETLGQENSRSWAALGCRSSRSQGQVRLAPAPRLGSGAIRQPPGLTTRLGCRAATARVPSSSHRDVNCRAFHATGSAARLGLTGCPVMRRRFRCRGAPARPSGVVAKPFPWTKTADEILERLASYLQRIPSADCRSMLQIWLDAPSWQHPLVLKCQYRCGCLEVGVVVNNGELVCGGEGRGEKVRHAHGSVLACSCQYSLYAQGRLPVLVIGRHILICAAAVRPVLLVFGWRAGTIERLCVQRRCGGDKVMSAKQVPIAVGFSVRAFSGRCAGKCSVAHEESCTKCCHRST